MTVEVASFISDLEITYPRQGDLIKEGDDHIRMIKRVVQQTFSGFNSFVTMTSQSMNRLDKNFKFSDDSTDIGGSVLFNGTQKTINFNKGGTLVNRNIVTGIPLPRDGTAGLQDAVSRDYLENQGGATRAAWPVGAIYISASDTNPASTLGFGTWAAFAPGRVLMGVGVGNDGSDTVNIQTPLTQGGRYYHTLTVGEMPSHAHGHDIGGTAVSAGAHNHEYAGDDNLPNFWGIAQNQAARYDADSDSNEWARKYFTSTSGAHEHALRITGGISATGGNQKHNNIQPYITVYMWRRMS